MGKDRTVPTILKAIGIVLMIPVASFAVPVIGIAIARISPVLFVAVVMLVAGAIAHHNSPATRRRRRLARLR